MDTLKQCYVTFGIPSYATSEEWDGDHILFTKVIIYLKESSFVGRQEHRNQPIGAGHAIYLIIPFSDNDRRKINYDNIYEIEVHLTCTYGNARDGGPGCRFRSEAVLEFEDRRIIGTGYPEPAPFLYPMTVVNDDTYGYKMEIRRPKFYDRPTLVEPIG